MNGLTTLAQQSSIVIPAERKAELVSRYQHLRGVSAELNGRLVTRLPIEVLQEGGRRLSLFDGKRFVFGSEDESSVLMDYCLYEVRRNGRTAIEQYLIDSPPPDGSDEMTVLRSMQQTIYSIFEIESVESGVGVHVKDQVSNETYLVVDMGLANTGQPGLMIATRLNSFGDFSMTGGAAIPIGVLQPGARQEFLKTMKLAVNSRSGLDPASLICACLKRGTSHVRYEDPFSVSDSVSVPSVSSHSRSVKRVGRNELCPCGSGKKFKHCCLPRA